MQCHKCGGEIHENSSFCNFCGEKQRVVSEKNKGENELASGWGSEKKAKNKINIESKSNDIDAKDKSNPILGLIVIAAVIVIVAIYSLNRETSTTHEVTSNTPENISEFLPFEPIKLCKVFDGSNITNDTKGWTDASEMGYGCGTPYKNYPLVSSDNPAQNEDDIAFYVMADLNDSGRYGRYATIMLNVNKKSHEKLRRADFLEAVAYFYENALGIKLDEKTVKLIKTFKEGFSQTLTVDGRELLVIFKRTPYVNNNGVELTMRIYPVGVEIPPVHQINSMKK
ncbi:TPA: hypothetical protein PXP51_001592 [Yersinia enterocolitica]|nr:hypothetical protein [Yersinia enterocolitica]HDL7749253.1 hypothetical protein [Yersinia enterocolitica]